MIISELKYKTKWFNLELPAVIVHASKGDAEYKVLELGEIFVNQVEDFKYYDVKSSTIDVRFFGKNFQIISNGPAVFIKGDTIPQFLGEAGLVEAEGFLGGILADFFERMGLPEL